MKEPTLKKIMKLYSKIFSSAEHFLVMKNWTGPFNGWFSMGQNNVIKRTHVDICFLHLEMQVIKESGETIAKSNFLLILVKMGITRLTANAITSFTERLRRPVL